MNKGNKTMETMLFLMCVLLAVPSANGQEKLSERLWNANTGTANNVVNSEFILRMRDNSLDETFFRE